MSDAKAQIRAKALALGFDAVGFAAAALGPEARARLGDFIAAGQHGDMGWLAERAERALATRRRCGRRRAAWWRLRPQLRARFDDPLAVTLRPDRWPATSRSTRATATTMTS